MTEPLTTEQEATLREFAALNDSTRVTMTAMEAGGIVAALDAARAGVHLGDEGLREALDRAAQHNHEEGGHQGYAGPTLYPDCADPWCREARAALAAQENPA